MSSLDLIASLFSATNTIKQQQLQDQIVEQNIKQKEFAARDALQRSQKKQSQAKESATRIQAENELQAAGQGLQLDRGTAALLSDEARELSERDVQVLRNNAIREAFGHKVDAFQIENQNEFNKIRSTSKALQTLATGGLKAVENNKTKKFNQSEARRKSAEKRLKEVERNRVRTTEDTILGRR